jgi:hypothetical protein
MTKVVMRWTPIGSVSFQSYCTAQNVPAGQQANLEQYLIAQVESYGERTGSWQAAVEGKDVSMPVRVIWTIGQTTYLAGVTGIIAPPGINVIFVDVDQVVQPYGDDPNPTGAYG